MWRSLKLGGEDKQLASPSPEEHVEADAAAGAGHQGPDRRAGGWPLATLVFLFGACLMVPAIAVTGLLLERQARNQAALVEQRVEQVAADLVDSIDRELSLMTAILEVMAASPELATGQFGIFHAWATRILQPLGLHVLYRDLDGQQLLNTRRAFGQPLPREVLPEIDLAVRTSRKPFVSNLLIGAVRGNFVVGVGAPVIVDGELHGVLIFSLNPERLLGIMEGQNLPPEWNTGLTDREGAIIARLRRHADFVGKPLPVELRTRSLAERRTFRTTDIEGVQTLRATRVSELTGWLVSANVPASLVRAAFVETLWSVAGAALVFFLVALALAVIVARLISHPIRQIAGFATMVENGHIPPRLQSPVREANEVAAALRHTSERLGERTHELRETLARFNAALRGADIVVFVQGLDRRITWISESAGYRARNFIGKREEDLVEGLDERAGAVAMRERVFETGLPQEGVLTTGKGETARHFRQHLDPIRDQSGEVAGILGVSLEITTLKQQQERNIMLVRELAHRSKNLLGVVQAIAGETLRTGRSTDDFMERFGRRLSALARLQDVVVSGTRGGAELRELVNSQLAPFAEPGPRLKIDGPHLRLNAEAANALGMALHELATNATKYGCLSVPDGSVSIAWQLDTNASGARRFRISWRERGGPPATEPERRGFGTTVVTEVTAMTLNGQATLDYLPGGVIWQVDAPATIVID